MPLAVVSSTKMPASKMLDQNGTAESESLPSLAVLAVGLRLTRMGALVD